MCQRQRAAEPRDFDEIFGEAAGDVEEGEVLDLALATTRGRESRFEQVHAIYDHTVSTLKYDKSGKGWGRGDIAYACDAKRGNCTDFHAVFIGLCRRHHVSPARARRVVLELTTDFSDNFERVSTTP